jgi:hypothetical protein
VLPVSRGKPEVVAVLLEIVDLCLPYPAIFCSYGNARMNDVLNLGFESASFFSAFQGMGVYLNFHVNLLPFFEMNRYADNSRR